MAAAALAAARADLAGAAAGRDSRRGTVAAAGAPTRAADSGRRGAHRRRRLATMPGCRGDNPPCVGAIKLGKFKLGTRHRLRATETIMALVRVVTHVFLRLYAWSLGTSRSGEPQAECRDALIGRA